MASASENKSIDSVVQDMEHIFETDSTLDAFADNFELLRTGMLAVAAKAGLIELTPDGLKRILSGAQEIHDLAQASEGEEDEFEEDEE